jgi:hypothetical protein
VKAVTQMTVQPDQSRPVSTAYLLGSRPVGRARASSSGFKPHSASYQLGLRLREDFVGPNDRVDPLPRDAANTGRKWSARRSKPGARW